MDIHHGLPTRLWAALFLAVVVLAGTSWADQPPVCTVPLYVRQGNLQATLLATRDIDGKRDRQLELNAGVPLVLDGLRLGGYNGWQGQAKCNFHGCLDDVRVYNGMLSDTQVAQQFSE